MIIQEEIARAIKGSANSNKKLDRNIEIILYYYGFGDIGWPALQNIANKFNIGTRERVRQVINSMFRDRFSVEDFDFLLKISDIITNEDHAYIKSEIVAKKLASKGFLMVKDGAQSIPSLRGLFNMLHDMGLCLDYAICHRDLSSISRNDIDKTNLSDTYIINTKTIMKLQKIVFKARSLPNKTGLIKVVHMEEELAPMFRNAKLGDLEKSVLMKILRESEDSLFITVDGHEYYAMDKKNNAVHNNVKKALKVNPRINIDRLAATVLGALRERGAKYPYPREDVIKEYLKHSTHFKVKNKMVFCDENSVELSPIENDIVKFFKNNGAEAKFPVIKNHLLELGYSSPHIVKSVSNSSIVFVDRSKGRGKYTYHMV